MAWDDTAVRIELRQGIAIRHKDVDGKQLIDMVPVETAEIWLSDDDGKILRRKKPMARLQEEAGQRSSLLRQIADWMDQQEDDSLAGMVAEMERLTS